MLPVRVIHPKQTMIYNSRNLLLLLLVTFIPCAIVYAEPLRYKGAPNLPGSGMHVVLVSGDEEYRSEEMVVQFGRILAKRHGFDCTVLFAINPESGEIDPEYNANIPHLEVLETADVVVVNLRFRNLPDEQMRHFDNYLKSGKPVLGIRTSTHAFYIPRDRAYARYSFNYSGEGQWNQGFGRLVLGETWITHHGNHAREATRGVISPEQREHPIVRGSEDIFGPTNVYAIRLPLPGDSVTLVYGQVLESMQATDRPVAGSKNDPMMPIAWTKTYRIDDGPVGRVFTSTIGSSEDFESEGLRRLLVNAIYWLAGLEDRIPMSANVDIVGTFETSPMGFGIHKTGLKPQDFALPEERGVNN
jgi:type 1 glutamine amidotransferase